MVVGICRLVLFIPHARSLKDKRAVVQSVIGRVRARFNVSIAEVDAQDVHREAVLGAAVAGSNAGVVRGVLEGVRRLVEGQGEGEITDYRVEILRPAD